MTEADLLARIYDFPDNPSDEEILSMPLREARIVVTLDKDFGNSRSFRNGKITSLVQFIDTVLVEHTTT
jgi:predicted nuclease of predicted toxin-antitoxin system